MKRLVKSLVQYMPFKAQLFKMLRLLPLPEQMYRHLHFKGVISVHVGRLGRFQTNHYGYQVENDIFWAGFGTNWEATSLRAWTALAQGSTQILDIGANTGIYALSAQAVNRTAQITAFEPVARISERLRANAALNGGQITVEQLGVSDHANGAVLYDVDSDHAYSASLEQDMLGDRADGVQTRIDTVRMDEYLAGFTQLGQMLVKSDVERHELAVLAGFGRVIADHRPSFLIEVLDAGHFTQIAPMFADLGYLILETREKEALLPVTEFGGAARNYLFVSEQIATDMGWQSGVSHAELMI